MFCSVKTDPLSRRDRAVLARSGFDGGAASRGEGHWAMISAGVYPCRAKEDPSTL